MIFSRVASAQTRHSLFSADVCAGKDRRPQFATACSFEVSVFDKGESDGNCHPCDFGDVGASSLSGLFRREELWKRQKTLLCHFLSSFVNCQSVSRCFIAMQVAGIPEGLPEVSGRRATPMERRRRRKRHANSGSSSQAGGVVISVAEGFLSSRFEDPTSAPALGRTAPDNALENGGSCRQIPAGDADPSIHD